MAVVVVVVVPVVPVAAVVVAAAVRPPTLNRAAVNVVHPLAAHLRVVALGVRLAARPPGAYQELALPEVRAVRREVYRRALEQLVARAAALVNREPGHHPAKREIKADHHRALTPRVRFCRTVLFLSRMIAAEPCRRKRMERLFKRYRTELL